MLSDTLAIFVGLFALMSCIFVFQLDDRQAFNCVAIRDARSKGLVYFMPTEDEDVYAAKGSVPCIEHVVAFVNKERAGPDGRIGTQDDTMTLERQINALTASMEKNFHGGYWIYSKLFRAYDDSVTPILSQIIYADLLTVVMLRIAPAGTTFVAHATSGHRYLLPLQGALLIQRHAPIRELIATADVFSPTELLKSSLVFTNSIRIDFGTSEIVSAKAQGSAVYLDVMHTHTLRASFFSFGLYPIIYGGDLTSAAISFSALHKSMYKNAWEPIWSSDEAQMASDRSIFQFSYRMDCDKSETEAEELFNAKMKEELLQKEAALEEAEGDENQTQDSKKKRTKTKDDDDDNDDDEEMDDDEEDEGDEEAHEEEEDEAAREKPKSAPSTTTKSTTSTAAKETKNDSAESKPSPAAEGEL